MSNPDLSRRQFLQKSSLLALSLLPLANPSSLFAAAGGQYGIKGLQAPPLKMNYWIDSAGQPAEFNQSQVDGKWVYLKCFQNWCPGCHEYGFPALKKVADEFHKDERVEVLGVQTVFEGFGINSQDSVRELQLRYKLPIMMGHDPGNPAGNRHPRTMREYRTGGTPWVVIIAPNGQVIYNQFHIDADKFITFLHQQLA